MDQIAAALDRLQTFFERQKGVSPLIVRKAAPLLHQKNKPPVIKEIDFQIINVFQLSIQSLQVILGLCVHSVINLFSGKLKRIQKNSGHNQHDNRISQCKTDQLFHKNRMDPKSFFHSYSPFSRIVTRPLSSYK